MIRHPLAASRRALTLCAMAVGALGTMGSVAHAADTLIGLTTDQKLLTVDASTPGHGSLVSISGLLQGESLLAIDLRPTTGVLYALSDMSNLYQINASTAQASGRLALSRALTGSAIGFDFNPAADLANAAAGSLRLTSNGRENWVINVATGAVTEQTALPTGFQVVGSAYINNDTNPATGTVLYNIDAASDSLYKQNPPASGAQELVATLGLDTTGVAAFDIAPSGRGYAAMTNANTGRSSLYTVDITATGAITAWVGDFGMAGNSATIAPVIGLTALAAPVPEPATWALLLGGLALLPFVKRQRA